MKTIMLPEDLGIKKVKAFYKEAVKVIDAGADCVVDFSRVSRIDLSVAQVLLAMQRECHSKGRNFQIRNQNETVDRLLVLAGVVRGLGETPRRAVAQAVK